MDPALSHAALVAMIDASRDGIALFDRDHRLIRSNAAFQARVPCPDPGQPFDQISAGVQDTGLRERLAQLQTAFAAGRHAPVAGQVTYAGTGALSLTLQPLDDLGFLLRIADTEHSPTAADDAQDFAPQLGALIDAAPINLVIYDLGRERFVYWTRAWADLYGAPQDIQQIWVDPTDRDAYVSALREQRRLDNFEARLRGRAGRIFEGRVSARLVAHGGTILSLAATTDMTEHHAKGERLAEALGRLSDPLSEITAQLLLLEDDIAHPGARGRTDEMRRLIDRCAEIVTRSCA